MSTTMLLAKLSWLDPIQKDPRQLRLYEDSVLTVGRTPDNDIQINEQHVSRYHARIWYQHGFFVVQDLDSSNGVFINDQRISEPYPLLSGDVIRLYEPILRFDAIAQTHTSILPCSLIVKNGVQAGLRIPLLQEEVKVGRFTANADWEIVVDDASVSRPHATFHFTDGKWHVHDLGSAYGTYVNEAQVNNTDTPIQHGDNIRLGNLNLEFQFD